MPDAIGAAWPHKGIRNAEEQSGAERKATPLGAGGKCNDWLHKVARPGKTLTNGERNSEGVLRRIYTTYRQPWCG